jgi:hypothetical protein
MMDKLDKMKIEQDAKAAAMDSLMEMLIENAPEEMAIDFSIAKAYRRVCELASGLVDEVTITHSEDYPLEAKKEVLEYLAMVADGIEIYTGCAKEQLRNSKTELN